jgi:hypothetical protein
MIQQICAGSATLRTAKSVFFETQPVVEGTPMQDVVDAWMVCRIAFSQVQVFHQILGAVAGDVLLAITRQSKGAFHANPSGYFPLMNVTLA